MKISNSKLKGIPRNNNEDRGPITSSTVFHSLKAMQDVHLCMYVCTVLYACVYVYIYVSQRDFRLMSFTAGRCGTPLILNDQFRSLRRNGVRSSDLILNDQLRRNGVRSSDLILNDQLCRNGVRSSDLIACTNLT